MALLAIARRLQLKICLSQFPHFLTHQFASPALSSMVLCVSRAFHRTPCRPYQHNPQLDISRQGNGWKGYQIINFEEFVEEAHGGVQMGEILDRVRKAKEFVSGDEAIAFLDNSGVKPDKEFIFLGIWALRQEWKSAFLVFKWGEKWDCLVEETWWLMIWLLANQKKFSTAWSLIPELHRASKDAQQAMLIMIDRYVAANYLDKAIQTFNLMQKFKFSPDQKTYFTFLDILCRHGNVEEAAEFMFINKKFFPLEVESFNIILNGWCNIARDIYEAKRVWREMSNCCIEPDGTSYMHMISCYSSVGNLFDSLRLYDQMKQRGWIPGMAVYHSLVYVLTRENCLDEALKIVDRMKETNLEPDCTTYNLIIRPLCEAAKFEEARNVLARMIGSGISPNIDTYHALILDENLEGILGVLGHMRKAGLGPNRSTFVLVLDRFCKLGEANNALKIWSKMEEYMVKPDEMHYNILVKGLAKCGWIAEARKLFAEMMSVGLTVDPSFRKLLDEPVQHARKEKGEMTVVRRVKKGKGLWCGNNKVPHHRKYFN